MKDTLISFETAKLAKEKGFNIECGNYYRVWYKEAQLHLGSMYSNDLKEDNPPNEYFYLAPTLSLAQKWLREVYNIHIVISVDFYKDGINYLWQVFKYDVTKKYNCEGTGVYGDNGEYPIYEQCLEAAIQESLKLIK